MFRRVCARIRVRGLGLPSPVIERANIYDPAAMPRNSANAVCPHTSVCVCGTHGASPEGPIEVVGLGKKGLVATNRASCRSCTKVAKAVSISRLLLALKTWICSPIARAAGSTSRTLASVFTAAGIDRQWSSRRTGRGDRDQQPGGNGRRALPFSDV